MRDHLLNLLGEPMPGHPDYRPEQLVTVDQVPVCRWCGQTEAKHRPASDPNRQRARTPCLLWRENFVPRLNQKSAASVPRCGNCGMVVSREGGKCERTVPCGSALADAAVSQSETAGELLQFIRDTCAEAHDSTSVELEALWAKLPEAVAMHVDALRRQFVQELWKLHTESGRINMIDSLYEYERQVKERAR